MGLFDSRRGFVGLENVLAIPIKQRFCSAFKKTFLLALFCTSIFYFLCVKALVITSSLKTSASTVFSTFKILLAGLLISRAPFWPLSSTATCFPPKVVLGKVRILVKKTLCRLHATKVIRRRVWPTTKDKKVTPAYQYLLIFSEDDTLSFL